MKQTTKKSPFSLLLFVVPAVLFGALLYKTVLQDAGSGYDPIDELTPQKNSERQFKIGNNLFDDKKYAEAQTQYECVIRLQPNNMSAHFNLGICLEKQRKWAQAKEKFSFILKKNPKHAPSYVHHARALEWLEEIDQAIDQYQQAVGTDPNSFEAHLRLGILYTNKHKKEQYQQALYHLKKAELLNADNAQVYLGQADVLLWQGKQKEAENIYQDLTTRVSSPTRLYVTIGQRLEHHRKFKQARTYYHKALALQPDNARAHVALAGNYFALGQYEKGLKEYEWRWHLSNAKNLPKKWDGTHAKDKTIMLLGENGLGDMIQFTRFAKEIKKQGGRVVARVSKPLVKLLSNCHYIDKVVDDRSPLQEYDGITSMQSVPLLCKVNPETMQPEPYITADKTLEKQWKQKIAVLENPHKKNIRVGICWAAGGDSMMPPHKKRSIALQQLAQLQDVKHATFYSLQKGPGLDEIKNIPDSFNLNVFNDLDTQNGSFMDTAALMKNMDVIITVDTSVAHLAGALGAKTILLLPYASDPRWTAHENKTPWYPNMTLLRQQKPGDWNSVIAHAKTYINKIFDKAVA